MATAAHSNLFVGNLNSDASEDRLRAAFSSYGAVESCRIQTKAGQTSGFVKMADVGSAERAVAGMNGANGLIVKAANFDIGGKKKLYGSSYMNGKGWQGSWQGGWGKGGWGKGGWGGMTWVPPPKLLPRDEEPDKPEGPPSENLYVKHLPLGITEEQLKLTFQKVGVVEECRLLKPGFSLEWAALVRMSTPEQGAAARQTLDNTFPEVTLPDPLSVKLQTKNGTPKDDHCYIKNLPTNMTKEKLVQVFSKYGEVKWCEVIRPSAKWEVAPWSAALVEMSPEGCQAAIAALDGQKVPFADLGSTVRVRYALNKDGSVPVA